MKKYRYILLCLLSIPSTAFAVQSFRWVYNAIEINIEREKLEIAKLKQEINSLSGSHIRVEKEEPKKYKWW